MLDERRDRQRCDARALGMVRSNSLVERWTPRLICLSVSSPNQRSTWFSQEALVGVKWACQRGRLANQSRIALVLWVP